MDDNRNESAPLIDGGKESLVDLGTRLGRRQAFGLIANRCSAADAECLKVMREHEDYKKLGLQEAGTHLGRVLRSTGRR